MTIHKKKAPIIGIVCCQKDIEGQSGQAVHEKYIDSVVNYGGLPIMLPSVIVLFKDDASHLLSQLDGILLTGSYSNVNPELYLSDYCEKKLDIARDSLSFKLLSFATNNNMPLLGVCRGLQEINVFFGGTLLPNLSTNPQFADYHSEDPSLSLDEQYGLAHDIKFEAGGHFSSFGESAQVNSLHKQAIDQLADDLAVEARSPDGLIEAVSHPDYTYLIGVQWHPEWASKDIPLSRYLFSNFIRCARDFSEKKHE